MSFKNPIKADQLPQVNAKAYLKMLAVLLTKKFLNGNSVPFMLVLNQVYKDLDEKKSERVPLLILGDTDSSWKDFHKKPTPDGDIQKKYTIAGMCRKNGDELVFDVEGSKGLTKIPNKSMQYLEALLKRISPNFSVSTTGGSAGTLDEELQATKVATVAAETKNSAKTVTKDLKNTNESTVYKAEKQEEAKKLSAAIAGLRKLMAASLKSVTENVKKGTTSGKDLDAVKATNKAYSEAMELFEKVSEPVRKKFAPAHAKLASQKKQLIKISLAAKQTKTTLAQRMADTYYQNLEKRKASKEEIQKFQPVIKSAIDYNNASKTKVGQDFLLKATAFVLKKVGVDKFDVKYVGQVLEKSAASSK